jgi:hypothetical protein
LLEDAARLQRMLIIRSPLLQLSFFELLCLWQHHRPLNAV